MTDNIQLMKSRLLPRKNKRISGQWQLKSSASVPLRSEGVQVSRVNVTLCHDMSQDHNEDVPLLRNSRLKEGPSGSSVQVEFLYLIPRRPLSSSMAFGLEIDSERTAVLQVSHINSFLVPNT